MDESGIKDLFPDQNGVKIIIRPYDPALDQAFIYSSWRNSAFYNGMHDAPRGTSQPVEFFSKKTAEIKQILSKAAIHIGCLEDNLSTIIGYSVTTDKHLDWIYVKVDYRKQGIGTMLLPKDLETVTDQLTKIGQAIVNKKGLKVRANGQT